MKRLDFFSKGQMAVIGEAGAIAEEVVTDHFALTSRDWLRWPYEVKSLRNLSRGEHPGDAYAHLVRYGKGLDDKRRGGDCLQFYRICLNDPIILHRTGGGDKRRLLPFMVYVLLHELVHIVRFGRYLYCPLKEAGRGAEEAQVDGLTRSLLAGLPLPGMDGVIGYFAGRLESPWAGASAGGTTTRDESHRRCCHADIRI